MIAVFLLLFLLLLQRAMAGESFADEEPSVLVKRPAFSLGGLAAGMSGLRGRGEQKPLGEITGPKLKATRPLVSATPAGPRKSMLPDLTPSFAPGNSSFLLLCLLICSAGFNHLTVCFVCLPFCSVRARRLSGHLPGFHPH